MSAEVYDSYHPAIFELVEKNLKVLDMGCATGKLGEKLRIEKNCFVVGVEIDKNMAKISQQRCDEVIIADLEKLTEIPFPHSYFNVIVFADVLEHLRNPETVLRQTQKWLRHDGYILASVPNVAYWRVRLNLLLGKFEYEDWGVLDRNHVRFFTMKTVKEMINKAG